MLALESLLNPEVGAQESKDLIQNIETILTHLDWKV